MKATKSLSQMSKTNLSILNFFWKFWIPVFDFNDRVKTWLDSFNPKFKGIKKRKIQFSAFSLIITYTIILCFNFSLSYKMLPAILIYMLWLEIFTMPHHLGKEINNYTDPIPYKNQAGSTASCKQILFFSKWILLNSNYHLIHHFYPQLPWHELKNSHLRLIKKYPEYNELHNELTWHIEARRGDVSIVLKEYFDYSEKLKKQSI